MDLDLNDQIAKMAILTYAYSSQKFKKLKHNIFKKDFDHGVKNE
jgi:hypothetical protein